MGDGSTPRREYVSPRTGGQAALGYHAGRCQPRRGESAVEPMTTLEYRYRGDNGLPGRFYFDKIVDGRTVVHAHMYPQDHFDVRKLVAFRDHLRSHHEAALAYEGLKRELASKFRDDRVSIYRQQEGAFINEHHCRRPLANSQRRNMRRNDDYRLSRILLRAARQSTRLRLRRGAPAMGTGGQCLTSPARNADTRRRDWAVRCARSRGHPRYRQPPRSAVPS